MRTGRQASLAWRAVRHEEGGDHETALLRARAPTLLVAGPRFSFNCEILTNMLSLSFLGSKNLEVVFSIDSLPSGFEVF